MMTTRELKIEGMSCQHCVMSVKKELSKLAGLEVEDVQIGSARIKVDETKVKNSDIAAAVEEAGYRLVTQ